MKLFEGDARFKGDAASKGDAAFLPRVRKVPSNFKGDAAFLPREENANTSSSEGRGGCAARSAFCASRPSAEPLVTRQECRVSSFAARQECRVSSGGECSGSHKGASEGDAATKGDAAFLPREEKAISSNSVPRPLFFDPSRAIRCSRGGNLPHWTQPNCTCFVTWRTADSLPREKLDVIQSERIDWMAAHPGFWSAEECAEYARLFEGRVQEWLDAGGGDCVLRDASLRKCVEAVILKFDRVRYVVYALVVMPNHVHVLFQPLGDESAEKIVSAWKGVSARQINGTLGKSGGFWQKESWDHLVRSERQFAKFVRYIRSNDPQIAYCVYGEVQ